MPRQKAQAAAAPPPSDAPKTVDDAADGPPGNAAETVAETGPEPDAPLPDEPNAHESANARQDGNDAIQAEAAKASARGTEMEGICDEFKGKSLAECVAMQPPPKAFAINMSGTSYNRTEKGTLTFSRVKGKYMMYGEQEHAMPNKAKLKMWDAFARLPSSYLKPDPIDPIAQYNHGTSAQFWQVICVGAPPPKPPPTLHPARLQTSMHGRDPSSLQGWMPRQRGRSGGCYSETLHVSSSLKT